MQCWDSLTFLSALNLFDLIYFLELPLEILRYVNIIIKSIIINNKIKFIVL